MARGVGVLVPVPDTPMVGLKLSVLHTGNQCYLQCTGSHPRGKIGLPFAAAERQSSLRVW